MRASHWSLGVTCSPAPDWCRVAGGRAGCRAGLALFFRAGGGSRSRWRRGRCRGSGPRGGPDLRLAGPNAVSGVRGFPWGSEPVPRVPNSAGLWSPAGERPNCWGPIRSSPGVPRPCLGGSHPPEPQTLPWGGPILQNRRPCLGSLVPSSGVRSGAWGFRSLRWLVVAGSASVQVQLVRVCWGVTAERTGSRRGRGGLASKRRPCYSEASVASSRRRPRRGCERGSQGPSCH